MKGEGDAVRGGSGTDGRGRRLMEKLMRRMEGPFVTALDVLGFSPGPGAAGELA